jgi:hypothetical protein
MWVLQRMLFLNMRLISIAYRPQKWKWGNPQTRDWGLPQTRAKLSRAAASESWHRRFKTACTRADKKMIDEVTEFIKRRTLELEQD